MNTQQATKRTNYGVRQTTINKLCVALTELSTKVKSDTPYKNLYDVFMAYSKRYKINKNLWYTMRNLGYIGVDSKGWYFKINRHEINQKMARLIISTFNENAKQKKGIRKTKAVKEETPKQEETPKEQESKKKEDMYVLISDEEFTKYLMLKDKFIFNSLEELKRQQTIGGYKVLKVVGKLDVIPTANLNLD